MNRTRTNALMIVSTLVLTSGLAVGIETTTTTTTQRESVTREDPRTETLARMSRRIDAEFVDQRAEDVFGFIADLTGADLQVFYESETDIEGIDPEALVSMKIRNQPALNVIDRLVRTLNAQLSPSTDYTWQMSEDGAFQVGPKSALDRETRTVIYDVRDLLFEIPNFDSAPDFQLQTSSGGSGGGTQSPFSGGSGTQDDDRLSTKERTDNLINVITTIVEPDSWVSLGGSASTITAYQGTLIVSAPDYVHRALGGYDFWPSSLQSKRFQDGRLETTIRPQRIKGP